MIILESKMNHLTLEELELLDPNPSSVIINKLLNQGVNRNTIIDKAVNKLATEIALIETNRRINKKNGKPCIKYNKSKQIWVSERKINGKVKHIKSGKDKKAVIDAYYKFCKENFLET